MILVNTLIDCSPENLLREIQSAEALRDRDGKRFKDMVQRYRGRPDSDKGGYANPENHAHEYLSLTISKLIFDNPRFRGRARRSRFSGAVAKAIQHSMNRWAEETDYRTHLSRVAVDMSFFFGASVVQLAPAPGENAKDKSCIHWPKAVRISPRRFIMDPTCEHWKEARYLGHMLVDDLDDLIEKAEANPDQGWDLKAIRGLAPDAGTPALPRDRETKNGPTRKEIVYYEIWVKGKQLEGEPGPEKGFNGCLYTLAVTADETGTASATQICKPRMQFGPRNGRYTVYGAYNVPDEPYPLSPLMAVEAQAADLNDHARVMSQSARQYKRAVLVNSADKSLVQKLTKNPDMLVIPVKGLQANEVVTVEMGGVTDQMLKHYGISQDRLNRMLAMGAAQKGNPDPDVSATADTIADESMGARQALIKRQFSDGVEHEASIAAWDVYYEDRVTVEFDDEAKQDIGLPGVKAWQGEPSFNTETGTTFEDLELELEPYSMERVSDAVMKAQAQQALQILMTLVPIIPQTASFVDWSDVLQRAGDAMNDPGFGDSIDVEAAAALGQQQAMAAQPNMRMGREIAGDRGGGGVRGGTPQQPQRPQLPAGPSMAPSPSPSVGMMQQGAKKMPAMAQRGASAGKAKAAAKAGRY